MDATTRWETEALRTGAAGRPAPPRPTAKRRRTPDPGRSWVTLREAESATGIPVNTLRKWVRRTDLPSYLESDGESQVRMIDLDAVRERARELGREIAPVPIEAETDRVGASDTSIAGNLPELDAGSTDQRRSGRMSTHGERPDASRRTSSATPPDRLPEATPDTAPETMIVPIDAWNKMLTQLGNLHEAGQQLADARERAAKAETEAAFLRRRLAEIRDERQISSAVDDSGDDSSHEGGTSGMPPSEDSTDGSAVETPSAATSTSFIRYVAAGWRNRRRGAD